MYYEENGSKTVTFSPYPFPGAKYLGLSGLNNMLTPQVAPIQLEPVSPMYWLRDGGSFRSIAGSYWANMPKLYFAQLENFYG